ncbi:hypothetical protein ACWEQ7_37525, partial [Streptomyces sp. NPDC004069]
MTGKRQDGDSILLKVSETPPCPRCGDSTILLEVLTEAVDGVTAGLDARWSVRGEEELSAVDR